MTTTRFDPGSFRDREGRVYYRGDKVCRVLSPRAAEAWEALSSRDFFRRLSAEGRIVGTRETALPDPLPEGPAPWVKALEHERIPFVTYPYEWSFHMLRDAALLQLDLILEALDEGMILKDASAYNVQWRGRRPVFIDVASFDRWEGDPWIGYLQFCRLFLYPLMLTAYRGLPFGPWLRGSVDGIAPEDCDRILSWRDRLRPGVFTHVYLHARLQSGAGSADRSLRQELREAGFAKELIARNVKGLRKIVRNLTWRPGKSHWSTYAGDNTYGRQERETKERFVREAARDRRRRLVWDLGSNTGEYSRIVAPHADYVVAIDGDPQAVDDLYLALGNEGFDNVLPLVNDLADASPAIGWRHRERRALLERDKPDLTLCLALIHHMVLAANVPLDEFVDFLASLGSDLVIEFVGKGDPMVKRLLRNKPDVYDDYEIEVFEKCMARYFDVARRETYHSGTRHLYYARRRDDARTPDESDT